MSTPVRESELRVLDARVISLADLASFYHSVSVANLAPVCSTCKSKTINETLLNDILTALIAHIERLEKRIKTLERAWLAIESSHNGLTSSLLLES